MIKTTIFNAFFAVFSIIVVGSNALANDASTANCIRSQIVGNQVVCMTPSATDSYGRKLLFAASTKPADVCNYVTGTKWVTGSEVGMTDLNTAADLAIAQRFSGIVSFTRAGEVKSIEAIARGYEVYALVVCERHIDPPTFVIGPVQVGNPDAGAYCRARYGFLCNFFRH